MSVPAVDDYPPLTLAEYLKFEALHADRHELVAGRVEVMAGGTERHDLLANQLNVLLTTALRGRCRVFPHNRKLLVPTGNVRYPDVLVHCGRRADKHYEDDATYLVEVRSQGDSPRHLTTKLAEYQQLPSLRQVLILDPESRDVVLYERHDLGWSETWVDHVIRFAHVDVDLDEVFALVDLEATGV